MPKISTKGITPQRKLFHDVWINVYPKLLSIEDITYWPENNRTIFTFERLEREQHKALKDIPVEIITDFVFKQDLHKLEDLAKSISRNGVQVPLIVKDDGKLLDGNRRYFACRWLAMRAKERNQHPPKSISEIPVHIIRQSDLDDKLELKILAEANFIKDLKVPWPLDAQARAVKTYYDEALLVNDENDPEAALTEVIDVFGITRQRALDFMGVLKLTDTFVKQTKSEVAQLKRREIVEDRFVYFWEFMNKATKGRGQYQEKADLKDVTDMFFNIIGKGPDSPLKNVKQIEPMVQAKRVSLAWALLKESDGAKLTTVVSLMNETKEVRKAEDKIRIFKGWLQEVDELSTSAKAHLKEVARLAKARSEE